MKIILKAIVTVAILPATLLAQQNRPLKQTATDVVERQRADLIRLSDQVWAFAETGFEESQSAEVLAAYAQRHGFNVERGVAGMPTAFVASYGSGQPVIAILGEYDALPGISQKAITTREPLHAGAAGHGCGHNLFGAASLGAAVAIKEMIAAGTLKGTIRFYGTLAEESIGGKIYMIREGLFKDVDVALAWHPDDKTTVDNLGAQANVQFMVEFRGKTAHAAADPWNARSAADAAEAFTHGINLLREHVRPTVRIHYTLERAGDVPNVVPDYARVHTWVRDSRRAGVDIVFARVQEIVRGAALIAGVEPVIRIQTGLSDMIILDNGLKLLHENLAWVGAPTYTEAEQAFAKSLQTNSGAQPVGMKPELAPLAPVVPDPPGGSTDVGDVSQVVPTLHFYGATAPSGVPWHAWPVVASSGMSIGHKGMMMASKALAATAVDLFANAELRGRIRGEFAEKTKGMTYKWLVPDGPPPVKR